MELILLGHILGDFYVQTDKVAEEKRKSMIYMLLHCLLYTIVTGISFCILNGYTWKMEILKISCLVYFEHLVVDLMKRECDKKFIKRECVIFLFDQVMHILILFLTVYIWGSYSLFRMNDYLTISGLDIRNCTIAVIAMLVCGKPAAVFVSLVFKTIPATIEREDQETSESSTDEDIRTGSWIGILEREIILILGLMSQFGAIGFVLTAKSLARFKQLENKSFAEKYLVGTLLSALIAIGCIAVCRINWSA
ncbi:MAG: DUF3307 domain-containing protein [Lachnospiraceae bacterium]|nr:DUF3307 domain-containing protein [Lachnospiraceae bacterium]